MFVQLTEEAYAQQKEVEDEENAPCMSAFSFKQPLYGLEDVIDDDVDEIQSQLDYHVRFFLRNRLCLYDTIYVTRGEARL